MNTKTLEITFSDASQKNIKLSLPKLDTSITKELVETQANKIVQLNILDSKGGDIQKAVGAQLIDKSVTVLF
ncbi:hypothetical protein RN70_10925 [Staphylococcus schleiferi]|uniref:DUF2922 domain-containing protein n=2 Tax=Staphylococcus TaxID=1279 RepID=A0A9X1EBE2_9STAP|nr:MULTISPECIES: DUF2922 domain-containing protein [Staphylococcus]QGS46845.1 DUF2922 family protein [Mammaliicoccus fleurettii]AKS67804.1 hypothetical protein LH95_10190 [Staphylococcus schleiferi]AKS69971.1 hypothetical protein NP71_10650 [Staphylococcus schleiferi]AKS72089.1 hypothetical protein OA96_09915 [Staphylococcus schleiferi]AKS74376.1 hypothetical protein RN70_10925 [Staphylococcus schleiferi]